MNVEELLKVLRDAGLDEEGIEVLLAEAIKAIHKDEDEMKPHEEAIDNEKAEASDLLGVAL